jgi:hypothetical protein
MGLPLLVGDSYVQWIRLALDLIHDCIHTRLRASIQLRISEDSRDGAGVERQEKECLELADRYEWPVVDVFTDNDISASSFSRKHRFDYERLVDAIKSGQLALRGCAIRSKAGLARTQPWPTRSAFRIRVLIARALAASSSRFASRALQPTSRGALITVSIRIARRPSNTV